jgi:hypothetical protein
LGDSPAACQTLVMTGDTPSTAAAIGVAWLVGAVGAGIPKAREVWFW